MKQSSPTNPASPSQVGCSAYSREKIPSDFYRDRNKAIYDTYLAVSRRHKEPITLSALVEEVRQSKQPRFWVPSRTVYNIIRRYLRSTTRTTPPSTIAQPYTAAQPPHPAGSRPSACAEGASPSQPANSRPARAPKAPKSSPQAPKSSPLSRAVIAAYLRIRDRRDLRGKSLAFVADFVTAEPSFGFYLSHRRLLDIIRRRRKQNFKQRCALALSGMQSYERHLAFYSKS